METPNDQIIGVKAFLSILNETLSFAFPSVIIEGEVSSFKVNQGKWVFFDLKDEDATLPCFMPVYQLKVPLEDGMKIRVVGVPKVTNWGKFSLTVKTVTLAGEGELRRAFELLKAKLDKEGLFEPNRKRELPLFPHTIGLITSGTSAAYADFIKILGARWGGLSIQLADIQVQGMAAPDQVINAINYFNQLATPPDVLVIIRGGGSLEDLQAFSTEGVARAVAASRTPTVVGVGHEVDISLADLVADRRAATPTDAARIVVPDRSEVEQSLNSTRSVLAGGFEALILRLQHRVNHQITALERFVLLPSTLVNNLTIRLLGAQRRVFDGQRQRLASLQRLLSSFNPQATLERGYAIVRHGDQLVTRPNQVTAGDGLVIQLASGKIDATIDRREKESHV
jgi:exodeoxyribonuclease VII large subunit